MPVFWNTITRRQLMILLGEEQDALNRRYTVAPALEDRPAPESHAFARWVACRRWCADAWNRRHAAAFAAGERALARLVAERDARDAARLGAPSWPREPFGALRWRRISGNRLEVAWLDERQQLQISTLAVPLDVRDPLRPVCGGGIARLAQFPPPSVLSRLRFDMDLSMVHGRGAFEDERTRL